MLAAILGGSAPSLQLLGVPLILSGVATALRSRRAGAGWRPERARLEADGDRRAGEGHDQLGRGPRGPLLRVVAGRVPARGGDQPAVRAVPAHERPQVDLVPDTRLDRPDRGERPGIRGRRVVPRDRDLAPGVVGRVAHGPPSCDPSTQWSRSFTEATWLASVAEIVTEGVAAAVAVPAIRPVAVPTERPVGRPPSP